MDGEVSEWAKWVRSIASATSLELTGMVGVVCEIHVVVVG